MSPRRPTRRSPTTLHSLNAAQSLWREGRFDDALRKYADAVRESPRDANVLIQAARAYGARNRREQSDALLETALRSGAQRADVQIAVAETHQMFGRIAEAERAYRRACRLAATSAAQLELARICERRHALDEAAELVDAILRAEPRSAAALMLRARIERRRGEFGQAETTIRHIIADQRIPPQTLAEAYGELSELFDATARYDDAWDAILAGKRIQLERDRAAWDAAQFVLARCQKLIESLTATQLQRWSAASGAVVPQRLALLTGFPRSGTTLLERALDAHPDIIAAEEKEIFSAEIFPLLGAGRAPTTPISQILDDVPLATITEARRRYRDATAGTLPEPIRNRLLIDKNPAMNLMIPPFRRVFPELKLVVALRDPRDVVLSCFLRILPLNPVSVCFLTPQRAADRYALDISSWLKMREMIDDWIEVRYEDTVVDLPLQVRRVLSLLEIEWDDNVLNYREHAKQRFVASPTYEAVGKPVFTTSLGRWQNYHRQLAPVLERLEPLVESLGYQNG